MSSVMTSLAVNWSFVVSEFAGSSTGGARTSLWSTRYVWCVSTGGAACAQWKI